MTHEDKDLLLKDLCARLPYDPNAIGGDIPHELRTRHFDVRGLIDFRVLILKGLAIENNP